MEEGLPNFKFSEITPILAEPNFSIDEKNKVRFKNFLLGLFFGLGSAIFLALFDLLLIAFVNPQYAWLFNLFVGAGPVLISIFYVFFLIYFFKRQRGAFWGILLSLFVFSALTFILVELTLI